MSESKANYEKFHALDTEFDATVNQAIRTLINSLSMMEKTANEIDGLISMVDCEDSDALLFAHATGAMVRLALMHIKNVRRLWSEVRRDDPNNPIPF